MESFHEAELKWEEQYENIDDALWREKGIALYREWLPSLKGEERHRAKLALGKLLLDTGFDLKIVYENYRKARNHFLEIMEDVEYSSAIQARAAYHLGYISRMLDGDKEAIHFFQVALGKPQFSVANQIKAHYQLTACFQSIGDTVQAQEHLRLGRELDNKREFQNEYENARVLLNNKIRPYLYFSSESTERIPFTSEEADEVIAKLEDTEEPQIILDWRSQLSPRLISEYTDCSLPIWEAKLIRAFTEKDYNESELVELLGEPGQLDAVNVKSKVSRLRESLKKQEIPGEYIKFKDTAYSWVGIPVHVILHRALI